MTDFTVFADADLTFGSLNVIHGENSSGKTHLMKLAYSVLSSLVPGPNEPAGERPTRATLDQRLGAKLVGVFRPDRGKIGRLARRIQGTKRSVIRASFGPEGELDCYFAAQSDRTVKTTATPTS